jgi:hypothetical protein
MTIMWNSRKYFAAALAAAGLAVAAATPVSAQYWTGYDNYTVWGPHSWNQGARGGPWNSDPADGGRWSAPAIIVPGPAVAGPYGMAVPF